jgi:hypothetical protein
MITKPYTVIVNDNAHYQDENYSYKKGTYATLAEAILACQRLVDDYFASIDKKDLSAEELFQKYMVFGEDPYIVSSVASNHFSAWDYAKQRARELARLK